MTDFLNTFKPGRQLGATGFEVTQLGIGDLADRSLPLETCVRTLRRALDAGLNLVDTAPGYENGYSEEIVGEALRQHGQRESIFLIDKIDFFDQPVAAQVDNSLRVLGQHYVDAFVLHNLSSMEQWTAAAAPGGLLDQLRECATAGKLRFIGISSHNPDVLHAAIASGRMDIFMFAIGPHCDKRYLTEILPACRERAIGTICFKTFGAGKLLGDTSGYNQPLDAEKLPASVKDRTRNAPQSSHSSEPRLPHLSVEDCLHYTLTQDPDVTLLGLSTPAEQDAVFAAALSFAGALSADRLAEIESRALEAVQNKGPIWWDPS